MDIHGSFLQEHLVDQLYVFITPWMLGIEGMPAFHFPGEDYLGDSIHLQDISIEKLENDLLLKATPVWPQPPSPTAED